MFSSARGLTGVAAGFQSVYNATRASSLYNVISADAFLTNQVSILNQGNTAEYQLFLGAGAVDGTNAVTGTLWTNSNKVIYDADLVISNAEKLSDKPYASGLIAYASIFKALAIGNLAMFWEKVPAGIGANINFVTRTEGFAQAIATLDKALAAVNAAAISPSFIANVPAGIDIVNTLHALKARYSLFAGNYSQALTSANAVDLTKKISPEF